MHPPRKDIKFIYRAIVNLQFASSSAGSMQGMACPTAVPPACQEKFKEDVLMCSFQNNVFDNISQFAEPNPAISPCFCIFFWGLWPSLTYAGLNFL